MKFHKKEEVETQTTAKKRSKLSLLAVYMVAHSLINSRQSKKETNRPNKQCLQVYQMKRLAFEWIDLVKKIGLTNAGGHHPD